MCLTELKNHQELVRTEQDSERKQEGRRKDWTWGREMEVGGRTASMRAKHGEVSTAVEQARAVCRCTRHPVSSRHVL